MDEYQGLRGQWGDGAWMAHGGPGPGEFLVDGKPPEDDKCPQCLFALRASNNMDSTDSVVEFWKDCPDCKLIWADGEEAI